MTKWESRVVSASFKWGRTNEIESVLAQMDADGWEVVGITSGDIVPPTVLLLFKRPVPNS
jgi:hypothetical protein